jgi:hypothetical protein
MHPGFTPAAHHNLDRLDPTRTIPTKVPANRVKGPSHDREHGYHDSLHSAEVAQLYPQVGNSITRR